LHQAVNTSFFFCCKERQTGCHLVKTR